MGVLESLVKHDKYALKDRVSDFSGPSQAALSALTDEWMDMRVQFHKAVSNGRDRFFVMRSFYQNLSSLFNMDDDEKVKNPLHEATAALKLKSAKSLNFLDMIELF